MKGRIETKDLSVFFGARRLLSGINLHIEPRSVCALTGPSGAGKSTLLRCLNRMVELDAGLRVEGDVLLGGVSIFAPSVDVDALRAKVGMIFQQPVVFPVSIYRNVIFGVRHLGGEPRGNWPTIAEAALRQAALWDEVRDRLHEPGLKLSVGQQQRLCLARTLAVKPEVILMDEPTSALDPKSTEVIESLILQLKAERTIVLVTHNLDQARRVADQITCLDGSGKII